MNAKQLKEVLANVPDDYEVRFEDTESLMDITAVKIQSDKRVHFGAFASDLECDCPYCDTLDKEVHSFE
jgi:hypothetical protein